ncbi:uncharacterized protein LOC105788173 isoform X2 [Gossypium raimondii]|uniref:uncharacterized protein LOC105788173 isoform X2 n=1 Tax=Gossypium raimondii TaxID=29730 RepID=UPI00063B005B|nr:uncharacterized protein LOC105788173 isoform X2 [Gossypium raimondii]
MKTEAKQRGAKSEEERRARHAATCRKSRQRIKGKREQLEQEIPMLKTESGKMKMEFENYKSKTELELQQLRRTIVEQKASEELMKQLFIHLMAYCGHNFGSFDQAVNWFASQNYAGGDQVSRASGAGLQNVNELVGSVPVPTIDRQHSMVDFDQQMFFGQDYTNVAASNAAGSAYTANHAVSSAAVWINSAADSSLGANHNLPEYGAMNNHNNLCNRDLAAGNKLSILHLLLWFILFIVFSLITPSTGQRNYVFFYFGGFVMLVNFSLDYKTR